ncbi:hypothetical protein [Streptomyces sp. NPDC091649]|uniref:hypothetical protein n=1 Tax=Streptomyces sp. NPDC091649 TaxID=3366004 RepID=UPI0037F44E7C
MTSLTGRLTAERFEKSLRVVINSATFRSSGQMRPQRMTPIAKTVLTLEGQR